MPRSLFRNRPIKTRIGDMRHRFAFDKRQQVNPDSPADLGNTQSVFVEQFRVWAAVKARLGGEAVMAARLIGHNLLLVMVRQSSDTELIGLDWRARDVNEGKEYAIKSIIDPTDGAEFFEILVETGVAE